MKYRIWFFLVVATFSIAGALPCTSAEEIYAKCLSLLDNPQRNLDETKAEFNAIRNGVDPLLDKPIESLSPEERAMLHVDELGHFRREVDMHLAAVLENPDADELSPEDRKILIKTLVDSAAWIGTLVELARSDIISAKRKGTTTRFHPDPQAYQDREKRPLIPEERQAANERIKALISAYEADDREKMVAESFYYNPPLKQEDAEQCANEIRARKKEWSAIISALKAGEGKGYKLMYESLREVYIRPVITPDSPPGWRIVQLRFRDEIPGCWVFNYQ